MCIRDSSYADLELAMKQENHEVPIATTEEHDRVIKYRAIRARSLHKMNPIPVFKK